MRAILFFWRARVLRRASIYEINNAFTRSPTYDMPRLDTLIARFDVVILFNKKSSVTNETSRGKITHFNNNSTEKINRELLKYLVTECFKKRL